MPGGEHAWKLVGRLCKALLWSFGSLLWSYSSLQPPNASLTL